MLFTVSNKYNHQSFSLNDDISIVVDSLDRKNFEVYFVTKEENFYINSVMARSSGELVIKIHDVIDDFIKKNMLL